jgi:hypothetical protein
VAKLIKRKHHFSWRGTHPELTDSWVREDLAQRGVGARACRQTTMQTGANQTMLDDMYESLLTTKPADEENSTQRIVITIVCQ